MEYICRGLTSEFAEIAGKRLLIVGGAGFLGYYLVQSVLHWNQISGGAPIQVTVYDNYIRGVPQWLTGLSGDPQLRVTRHDITQLLPPDMDDFQFVIHAASIASPTFYRQYPIETMDANVNGLRTLLEYALRQQQRGVPVEAFLYFSTSEIYGDPTPENIPTPETYRGSVSCTGPRACYDESKRYGETLCVNFAQRHASAGQSRPAVQQLRPWAQDHRPARLAGLCPRHICRSRHRAPVGRLSYADVLLHCRRHRRIL